MCSVLDAGSLAPSQESSECEVSRKGILHQPRGCALPGPRRSGTAVHTQPSLRPDRGYSSVRGFCPPCALLDDRKFCVFFSFLRFLSFPQTQALTVLLASPEEFTKEARGVPSGGAGAAGLRERRPPCPGPSFQGDGESCVQGQRAVAGGRPGRRAWRAEALGGSGAGTGL